MTVTDLPTINAVLNGISALLLVWGWVLIKGRNVNAHRRVMIAAFASSALFLVSYLVYHAQVGSKPYPGTGVLRVIYFSILIPHVILAAVVLPMALVTLKRGLLRNDAAHRRLARVTLPVWLFVSATGVLVYLMLYQWV